jgi:hypothetical protein
LGDVRCEFDRAALYLRGHLPSHSLKQVARATVAALEGTDRLVSRIEIEPSGGPAGMNHGVHQGRPSPPDSPLNEE